MKLYVVEVLDDTEESVEFVVANSKEEAEQRVSNMEWSCLMSVSAYQLEEVDGFKIRLEKLIN